MRKALHRVLKLAEAFDAKDVATLLAVALVGLGTWGLQGWAVAFIVVGVLILFGLGALVVLAEGRRNGPNRQYPEQ